MSARVVAAVGALAVVAALPGCDARIRHHAQPRIVTTTSTPSPAPTITVVRSGRVLAAGLSAEIVAQPGVSLRLRASRPGVSRNRLSSSYGYPPSRGYYVTFTMTITNTGTNPLAIGPGDFRLGVAGEPSVTVYQGNAPYSGASSQLDNTQLDPGQTVRAPLTFDVRRTHGTLSYLPDKTAAVTWRF